jgi:SulP family sulfate permease
MSAQKQTLKSTLTPKLFIQLKAGYSWDFFKSDLFAGFTVAIIALPLAMALAIASGTTPDRGLFTAVIAGFIIALFGGSRYQVSGPTGAFVVVIYSIIDKYGYEGLVVATLMAGIFLMIAGISKLGTLIKYIPHPIITGFTAGIGVVILFSQIKDLLGMNIEKLPADFISKFIAYIENINTISPNTVVISGLALTIIFIIRAWRPNYPSFLISVITCSIAVSFFNIPLETIGSKFDGIPSSLPTPSLQIPTLDLIMKLIPSALTIAFLAGLESLLSAVIADSLTGTRHKSNCELFAQGLGNIASALFGGIPATGALARTAVNIKCGAKTPLSGMFHAIFLFMFMLLFAQYANSIPIAALSAILVLIAWNMIDMQQVKSLLYAPKGDRIVFLITFALTILIDITVAVEIGMIMALLVFTIRMIKITEAKIETNIMDDDETKSESFNSKILPKGVQLIQISGPFFFGVASMIEDLLSSAKMQPKSIILHLNQVPFIDATGAQSIKNFISTANKKGIFVILSGIGKNQHSMLENMDVKLTSKLSKTAIDLDTAIKIASG